MASPGNLEEQPTIIQSTDEKKKSGCGQGCKYALVAGGVLVVLLLVVGGIGALFGVGSPSSSQLTDQASSSEITTTIVTQHTTAIPRTSAIPQTSTQTIQAALDDANVNSGADSVVAEYNAADKILDVAITDHSYWDDPALKRELLEKSYDIMAVVVTFPNVDMVRIKGYTNVIDSKGNEKLGVVYQAVASNMAKARQVNWKNLYQLDQDVAAKNFDSTGGMIMDA